MDTEVDIEIPYDKIKPLVEELHDFAGDIGATLQTLSAGKAFLNGLTGTKPGPWGAAMSGFSGTDDIVALSAQKAINILTGNLVSYGDLYLEFMEYAKATGAFNSGDMRKVEFLKEAFKHLVEKHTTVSGDTIQKLIDAYGTANSYVDVTPTTTGVTITIHPAESDPSPHPEPSDGGRFWTRYWTHFLVAHTGPSCHRPRSLRP